MTNLEIVKKGYECFGSGDIEGLLALFSESVTWTLPELKNASHGGTRRGKAETADFFRLLNEAEDITHFEPQEFIAEGDRVVVLGTIRATARATGRDYASDWVHIFRVTDGKISSFHEFFDNAAVDRAFQRSAAA